jgi:hypothetical protein
MARMSCATFCSHLAMYLHLSPAALDAAIRLLETGTESCREILEAAGNQD